MKYRITYYYHTTATVEVDADSVDDAISQGYNKISNDQILNNIEEFESPDVEEILDRSGVNGRVISFIL